MADDNYGAYQCNAENDEFKSRSSEGKLIYSMPSISELFNGLPLEQFTDFSQVDTDISVLDIGNMNRLACDESNKSRCKINFSWDYTPVVSQIIPPVVYKGMEMTVYLNPKKAPSYYDSTLGGSRCEIRIDGTSNDFGFNTDGNTELRSNTMYPVASTVMTDERNSTADLKVFMRGAGNAWIKPDNNLIYSLDGTESYTMKVLPSIDQISHSEGSTTGG